MNTQFAEHAAQLAASGYPVFPLQPRSKEPYPGTRGFMDATTDAAIVRRFWELASESNIGLRPPPGVLVVDIDPRNAGHETLHALEAQHGPLPPTLTAVTGGGGLHAYFRVPAELAWPKELGTGIDLKGPRSYVLAPPSVHDVTGRAYTWSSLTPMADAPAWLVAHGYRPEERERVVVDEDEGALLPSGDVERLGAELGALFEAGKKHQLAFALGGWLRQRGWNSADVAKLVRLLPSKNPSARVKDALDGFRARNDHGWHVIKQLCGEAPAAALDVAAPNPRRVRELAERAEAAALLPALGANAIERPMLPPPLPIMTPANGNAALPPMQSTIAYNEQDEHSAVDAAIGALSCSASVYQRGGLLVHVARDLSPKAERVARERDAPRIAEMQAARLRDELSKHSKWAMFGNRPIGVPVRVVEGVRARDEWHGIRSLRGIAEFPIVRPDGDVVQAEGYDDATGVYVAPSCQVNVPQGDPGTLANWLLAELVGDFPFASPSHRSAWLAALLTPLARYAFSGPTPLMLIDKNVRGSGGSLLADLIGIVCTGRPLPRMSQALDEAEENKRLLGLAVAGDPVALLDNINAPLGNGALDRALTGTSIRDRWLGGNQIVTAPWNCMLVATGNNMQLVGDTTRRALPVRLESPEERPEERANFRHVDVRRFALEQRAWLLGAGLAVLSAHLKGGGAKPKPWGSFEGWSDVVRGAVIGCGLSDPCEGRAELVAVDSEAETARALIDGVAALGATSETTARPVKDILAATLGVPLSAQLEALRDALAVFNGPGRDAQGDARTAHRVGNGLRRYRGRVVGGRKLTSSDPGRSGNVARWYVVAAQ